MSKSSNKDKIFWITRTAVLMALLVTLQWITASLGQFVTGTAVNCVLAVATLLCGLFGGLVIATISPWIAFLLNIGPGLIQIVPCISIGNIVFVTLLSLIIRKTDAAFFKKLIGIIVASVCKFGTLYLLVVKVFVPLMGAGLQEKQIAVFTAMFSWPQLVTALAGSVLALLILPVINIIKK